MLKKIRRRVSNIFHPVIGEVWELHRVMNIPSEDDVHKIYEIKPDRLESLIRKYVAEGYSFISMADVRRAMLKETRFSQRFVAVTLDDGFEDNCTVALPIFRKYNIPFCIYIMQRGVVGKRSPHFPQFLHEDQIIEIDKDPLCTIGSHTYSHPRLAGLKYDEQYREIITCHRWLENLLKHPIVDFSYPFGSFNQDTIKILRELGIQQSPIAWGGEVRRGKGSLLMIPRVLITENDIYK